ncbi:alpha/beta hydrolase [Lentiprolixibacter aurantiacus]|uniref:Alpha/beta fold hydrolase n=1 Tax=Lentiprolixibacter aurantiacus TaxID=2993939 RepID=A0AAE3MM08_9FLAO|nr:alpha/beta hydrolase [Lentiprolixibacter aurantiacus]MCX2720176.1 alpha/beta fold hydrolase [Lentiprolixibacter aurantiacus]
MRIISLICFFFLLHTNAQEIISEEIAMANGDIMLPGTLSYPEGSVSPLVIFIQGSGNVDRDGNQAGTVIQSAYIRTLRDSLNHRGIAFYSYDKRTAVGANFSKLKNIVFEDLVADARQAVNRFLSDNRFASVHVIGHSQGSLAGMMSLSPEVSSFISLAGPGVSIDKKIIEQIGNQSADLGKIVEKHFQELRETDTIAEINPMLYSIFAPQNQRFLKLYTALDPSEEIKKVSVPTLIINGEADLQVSADDARLLHEALPESRLEIIPKLNHVLKEVNSLVENQQSYMQADIPLSPALLDIITAFIIENQ